MNSASLTCVVGQPSVGKTTLVETFFSENEQKYIGAWINCLELTTSSQLYHSICNALLDSLPDDLQEDNRQELEQNLSHLNDFYKLYHKLVTTKGIARVYLIFDNVETLKRVALFESLIFLSTIPDISCIWISIELPHSILGVISNNAAASKLQDRMAVVIVTPWDKTDLVEVVLKRRPSCFNYDIYRKYVQNVISILYVDMTRDVNEINTFCQENFENFLDLCSEKNVVDLENGNLPINNSKLTSLTSSLLINFRSGNNNFEDSLDGYIVHSSMRILLVALYIAAHTRASDDKYNFIKFQKRKSKSRSKSNEIFGDSQTFCLERVVQIYRKLAFRTYGYDSDELAAVTLPDSLFGDLLYLRDLRYVQVVVGDGISSATRLKLARPLNYNYVDRLAQKCGLRLFEFSGLPELN